jgi:hypothetical protein
MEKNYVSLKEVEKVLKKRFNKKTIYKTEIPQAWGKYPISWLCYGKRDVCVRETSPMWSDDDVMSDVINLFDTYYGIIVEKIKRATGIADFDNKRTISVYVQPDYLDTSVVLIIQRNINNLVYIKETKAWHKSFETPKDMESELIDEYDSILKNVK